MVDSFSFPEGEWFGSEPEVFRAKLSSLLYREWNIVSSFSVQVSVKGMPASDSILQVSITSFINSPCLSVMLLPSFFWKERRKCLAGYIVDEKGEVMDHPVTVMPSLPALVTPVMSWVPCRVCRSFRTEYRRNSSAGWELLRMSKQVGECKPVCCSVVLWLSWDEVSEMRIARKTDNAWGSCLRICCSWRTASVKVSFSEATAWPPAPVAGASQILFRRCGKIYLFWDDTAECTACAELRALTQGMRGLISFLLSAWGYKSVSSSWPGTCPCCQAGMRRVFAYCSELNPFYSRDHRLLETSKRASEGESPTV